MTDRETAFAYNAAGTPDTNTEVILETTESEGRLGTLDLPLPTFVPRRYQPGNVNAWSGHLAFASDLVGALRPSLLVELGTHYGESYFTFCQSAVEHGISCLCYAVDHWRGEEHSEQYGDEVFREVSTYNKQNYRDFSYLLRTSFDDARAQFGNETVDLLHIDGLHTFDAVRHDFESWLPKVKRGGVILLHDIAVRHGDFGVWRLWEQLAAEFPETFAFHHSWGLGVLRKPGAEQPSSEFVKLLFESPPARQERIRRYYTMYAAFLEHLLRPMQDEGTHTRVQVFPSYGGRYSEETSATQQIETGSWQTLEYQLQRGAGDGRMRIDPADCTCVIELGEISVRAEGSGEALWSATTPEQLRGLELGGTATLLPHGEGCVVFSYGDDPQILLPPFAPENGPVIVRISLRADRALDAVVAALSGTGMAHDAEVASLQAELKAARAEIMLGTAELSQVAAERNEARRELKKAEQLAEAASARLAKTAESSKALEAEIEATRRAVEAEREARLAMERSISWRATQPARSLMTRLRRLKAKL